MRIEINLDDPHIVRVPCATALKPSTSLSYRPEIDGLRAIAVTSVVLFHADLGLPGGYVGVDVFFIISGFLITSLILRDLRDGRFSLADFWERRARRILPALVPAAIAALLLSIAFLPPASLVTAAKSSTWLGAFASNVFFCRNSGYFSAPAEGQPLLHTWSLAVEEQFYLFFPPLLLGGFVLVKRSMKRLLMLVVLLAGASFIVSIRETNANPTDAFYLLHTRAFELLIGAILAFVPPAVMERLGRIREILSLVGLGVIVWACFGFTNETPFPGYNALVPCLGAALFILANMGHRAVNAPPVTWSGRALAWRPFVFIGLVSYSFYLWHWPPLAIANHWHIAPNAPLVRAGLALGAFVCAVLSWRFVERPFRQTPAGSKRIFVGAAAACSMGALMASGAAIAMTEGALSRVPPAAYAWGGEYPHAKFMQSTEPYEVRTNRLPIIGIDAPDTPPSVLVWGDSHAMVVTSVLDEVCRETGRKGIVAAHASTAPLRNYFSWGNYALNERSIPYAEAVFDLIKREKIRDVVLVAYWNAYFEEYPSGALHPYAYDPFSVALLQTIKDLQALGVRVIFQRQAPNYTVSVPEELAWRTLFGLAPAKGEIGFGELRYQSPQMDALERDIVATGVTIVDAVAALSTSNGTTIVANDGKSLYTDRHHLSIPGATRLLPAYRAVFAQTAR